MKKLPIGIQTFSKIIEGDFYYVDKTKILSELVNSGSYFFLSRPRRFGKSLFLDTLREAFLGNKEFFQGLYLEKNWDWSKKHPVIRIDFGGGVLQERNILDKAILEGCSIIDSDLSESLMNGAKANKASFKHTVLEGVEAKGIDLSEAELSDFANLRHQEL